MIGYLLMQQMSKQGIPVFNDDADFYELFTGKKSEKISQKTVAIEKFQEEPEENFAELLEQSFSETANFQTILREKDSSLSARKSLTIKEKLKKYPPPEVDIDLHGCTAEEARKKTETVIRNARYNAIRTIRIIVGKGIHSRGKAVLPDIVEKKVVDLKQKDIVLTFQWEKRRKLKSGSMIVYLK